MKVKLQPGYEATLSYSGKTGKLEYGIYGGIWYNHSKIIQKPDALVFEYDYRSEIGKPVGQLFGYVANGFWDKSSLESMTITSTLGEVQAGDIRYVDFNGDTYIDNNDMTSIGYTPLPEYTYSISVDLKYKNIFFYILGQGTMNSSEK